MLANNSHIFTMSAVVSSPTTVATLCDALFITNTVDIVQPNLFRNTVVVIKSAALRTKSSLGEIQHSAYDVSFLNPP